ncbi:alpha/beta fold hydrolase [Enemella sp. A6]|uniref:alpha/beta fold hydrolase n=1 Tax=Enemella sp. A6 TaxID=3440152 RepID=UPI003EBDCD0E
MSEDAPGKQAPPEPVVFLHGLGETPQAWQDQVLALPAGHPALAPWLLGTRPGRADQFDLTSAAAAVATELDRIGAARARLCGVSLGATVALQAAMDYPDRVSKLVVCAAQVAPPKAVLVAQRAMLRMVPRRKLADKALDKDKLLAVLKEFGKLDISGRLGEVRVPTRVLIGADDRANKPAARLIAHRIAGAELHEIPGAGHTPHSDNPDAFNRLAIDFLIAA